MMDVISILLTLILVTVYLSHIAEIIKEKDYVRLIVSIFGLIMGFVLVQMI